MVSYGFVPVDRLFVFAVMARRFTIRPEQHQRRNEFALPERIRVKNAAVFRKLPCRVFSTTLTRTCFRPLSKRC
jgi:hypothetical protein